MKRIPILATIVVLLAVGAMIGLGVWQLHRLQWKEALLAHYREAPTLSADVAWPRDKAEAEKALYRHAAVNCGRALNIGAEAGHNDKGQTGWASVARCRIDGAGEADVVLGWSKIPETAKWTGGPVQGIVGPGRDGEARLIAAPQLAGLAPNAVPDPKDIPNNHLSYAIQWFLFAGTALVIYVLAARKRWLGK
ncbi:MAG: SURF1 family protein [Candidatus Andeanibacterium colombiense]|uniref:SURF1-like protein n=1 Tax=Candidatus Andeanibacterium colombiense TaxID=3121345 RepID=A0AAJ5XB59_9SPHN|nr:MAG: SURF1 family protein [Sphingomonadaceae bacterium]